MGSGCVLSAVVVGLGIRGNRRFPICSMIKSGYSAYGVSANSYQNNSVLVAVLRQMRMGMTTYLKVLLSGMVSNAELLPSDSSTFTMSWLMLARASMR